MTQVAGVLKTTAKDFNVAALVSLTRSLMCAHQNASRRHRLPSEQFPLMVKNKLFQPKKKVLICLTVPPPPVKPNLTAVAGYEPRDEEQQRGGAAGPRGVVGSRPQNQDPAGAGGRQPVQSPLCDADQVFQTGRRSPVPETVLGRNVSPFKPPPPSCSSPQPCGVREEFDLRWWSRAEGGSSGKRRLEETDS